MSNEISEHKINEILFWTPQLKEHALFLYLGLQPVPIIVKDLILESDQVKINTQVSEKLQKNTVDQSKFIDQLKTQSLNLYKEFTEIEKVLTRKQHHFDFKAYSKLVSELRDLKVNVLTLQKQQVWVGWIFPSFVEHILSELEYFIARLDNAVSPEEEIVFWVNINSDHVAFAAHLLDIGHNVEQRKLVNSALDLSLTGQQLNHADMDFQQMIRFTQALRNATNKALIYAGEVEQAQNALWNKGKPNQSDSIIHPLLLAHVARENERSRQRLTALGISISDKQSTVFDKFRQII